MTPNGTAIRAFRQCRDLGIRELAKRSGINRGYLSRLERGLVAEPSEARMRQIAIALDVPVAAINREEQA